MEAKKEITEITVKDIRDWYEQFSKNNKQREYKMYFYGNQKQYQEIMRQYGEALIKSADELNKKHTD